MRILPAESYAGPRETGQAGWWPDVRSSSVLLLSGWVRMSRPVNCRDNRGRLRARLLGLGPSSGEGITRLEEGKRDVTDIDRS